MNDEERMTKNCHAPASVSDLAIRIYFVIRDLDFVILEMVSRLHTA
jgi:hypothetical protein